MKVTCLYQAVVFSFILLNACKKKDMTAQVDTISTNLPFSKNPDGYWQVGYSAGDTPDPSQFVLCTFAGSNNAIQVWHPAADAAGYYPYTGQNTTMVTQVDLTNSWAARAGEIVMEGSNNGQYSMVRFVAPRDARYKLKVIFEGVHFRLSSTDVHVLLNSEMLFSDLIDGYGGDSLFHAIAGTHPVAVYEAVLGLKKNDVLSFAVGYGANKTFYNDTTGLLIYIEFV